IAVEPDVLNGLAVVGRRERIEAWEGAETVRPVLDQGNRRDELVLVVEIASVHGELTAVERALQRRRQLAAFVRLELRVAYAIRRAEETSDAAVPALREFEARVSIHSSQIFSAVGQTQAASGRVTRLEQKVRRGAHLAAGKDNRWAALQDFDRPHGVVETEDA